MLRISELSTSAMPSGELCSVAASARVISMGNRKLPITATTAAKNVATTYNTMMVFIEPSPLALASELNTRKNTRTGATERRALTNRSPRVPIQLMGEVPSILGNIMPSTAPNTRKTRMRLIKLMLSHFLQSSFMGCVLSNTAKE